MVPVRRLRSPRDLNSYGYFGGRFGVHRIRHPDQHLLHWREIVLNLSLSRGVTEEPRQVCSQQCARNLVCHS